LAVFGRTVRVVGNAARRMPPGVLMMVVNADTAIGQSPLDGTFVLASRWDLRRPAWRIRAGLHPSSRRSLIVMDRYPDRRTFEARLEGGPRHASVRRIWALVSGEPPDFVYVPGSDEGVYARAGGPGADGHLPYWWMTWTRAAALRCLVVTPRDSA
jgi:hypothetical protein